jgi:hypothetical protein
MHFSKILQIAGPAGRTAAAMMREPLFVDTDSSGLLSGAGLPAAQEGSVTS